MPGMLTRVPNRRARRASVVCGATVIWLAACCVFGQADMRRIEEAYTARRWGVEDGLPEGIVTSVVQFPDGFVWLTTPRHVIRFDGVEFLPCAQASYPADKPKKFNRILRDRQGRVWVSGENGVMRRDGDVWHKVPPPGLRVQALLEQPNAGKQSCGYGPRAGLCRRVSKRQTRHLPSGWWRRRLS